MRKTTTFLLTIILLTISIVVNAIPAKPGKIEYKQPDGQTLTITLHGDEFIHWAETVDHYTVLQNEDGYYAYAIHDKNGLLAISDQIAHNPKERKSDEIDFLKDVQFQNRFDKSQVQDALNKWGGQKGIDKRGGFPTVGSNNLIMILANFNNTSTTFSQSDFDNYMNQEGFNGTGSFKDYYLEVSYGQLVMTTVVTAWVTVPNTHDYYGPQSKWGEFARDAVEAADAIVDYSQFDNDGDGDVDGVAIIHQGTGQEASGNTNDIWSHSWNLSSAGYTIVNDGVTVDAYTTQPEIASGGGISTIGVMCHEFGHNLGAPDYYDTDYSTNGSYSGTGQWDMMAGGSWNNSGKTPAHHNPFTKWKYYEWINPTELTNAQQVSISNSVENSNDFYYYTTPTTDEYWLIENRQNIGFDTYVPGHGLLIFHVDEPHINSHDWGNDINVGEHQGLYPVCASATGNPPTTYGTINSGGTPFPGTGNKTEFTDQTTPASISWAGDNTNKPITNITEQSNIITFDFMGGGNNPSNFIAVATSVDQINLNWDASDFNGVVLAYSQDGTFGTPVDGTTYNAGSNISGGGTVLYNGTSNSYNHTNLQSSTTYYYKIWGKEDALPTYTSGATTSESTLCGIISSLPYTNDFAGNALPVCWENIDNEGSGNVWLFNNPDGRTFNSTTGGNGFAIIDSDYYGSGSSQDADMISPTFNLTNYTSISLSFEHYFYYYDNAVATLSYSTDNGTTWTQIDSWTGSNTGSGASPAIFNQDLTNELAGESSVKFKWGYTGSYDWYWAIDDIEIDGVISSTETVTFTITDADDSHPINGASISINSQLLTTNSSGQATIDLADGTYAYTVNMAGYYEETGSVNVNGSAVSEDVSLTAIPPVTFDVIVNANVTCNGGNDGIIEFSNATGGSGAGYEYSLNGGVSWQTSAVFSDLSASSYVAQVKDGNGMISDPETISVTEPDAITFDVNITNVSTYGGNDGAIEVINVAGGNGTYEYSNNAGTTWQAGDTFSGLTADTYSIQVRDANLCTSEASEQTINQPDPPIYTVTFNVTDADDSHAIDGAEININSTVLTTNASGVATIDLEDGNYSYTVSKTDYAETTGTVNVSGAATTVDVPMDAIVPLTFAIETTDVTCNGGADGIVEIINAAGGSGSGYQFSIDNGSNWQTSAVFNGLSADTYSVVIKDSDSNVSETQTSTIGEPSAVVLVNIDVTNVSIFGGSDGVIVIEADGGTAPYEYSIDGGTTWQNSNSFTNLIAESYTVFVSDDNGCVSDSENVTVTQPAEDSYTVTFTVYENDHVVENAIININSETLTTNIDGICSIELTNGTYAYTASYNSYVEIPGEVIVNNADVNEYVNFFIGLENIPANQISIYPNPSNGIINIEFEGNYTVALINSIGEVVQTQEMKSKGVLETAGAADGLYLLRIEQNGKVLTKPIIIKK